MPLEETGELLHQRAPVDGHSVAEEGMHLFVDVAQVSADGTVRHVQPIADLPVGAAVDHEIPDHAPLGRGQLVRQELDALPVGLSLCQLLLGHDGAEGILFPHQRRQDGRDHAPAQHGDRRQHRFEAVVQPQERGAVVVKSQVRDPSVGTVIPMSHMVP